MTNLDDYRIREQPYYKPVGSEVALFEAAYQARMPMMLKGPTGCGKTRFIEFMAWRLEKPLVTVACHEDMTASDLVGRFLLDANGTVWHDGPLSNAVRYGAICYLDEIVEARQDTNVSAQSISIIPPPTSRPRSSPMRPASPPAPRAPWSRSASARATCAATVWTKVPRPAC